MIMMIIMIYNHSHDRKFADFPSSKIKTHKLSHVKSAFILIWTCEGGEPSVGVINGQCSLFISTFVGSFLKFVLMHGVKRIKHTKEI
jgi:hypothetical protein